MSLYWSKHTAGLKPYTPGEQPQDQQYIKLNTNENPYPPSPLVYEAIRDAVNEKLRLYPDPESVQLRNMIASYYHVKPEEVFVGNGSDEVLAFSFQAFFDPERPILFPDISYSFYPVYANLFRIPFTAVPLNQQFEIDVEAMSGSSGGVIFPNPNAPTSIALPLDGVRRIAEANPEVAVIIDEAYVDFGAESALPLIREYPNVLVVRTMSKSRSLAGLRIGFAIGQRELIEGLNRIKHSFNSYTMDRIAGAAATASFHDEVYYQEKRKKIIDTREQALIMLKSRDFEVLPSSTNFLFICHPQASAEQLYLALKASGVLVRYFKQERISNYLRVTIGTDEEMKRFFAALDAALNEKESL